MFNEHIAVDMFRDLCRLLAHMLIAKRKLAYRVILWWSCNFLLEQTQRTFCCVYLFIYLL